MSSIIATITSGSGPDGPTAPTTTVHQGGAAIGYASMPSQEPAPARQPQGFRLSHASMPSVPVDLAEANDMTLATMPDGYQGTIGGLIAAGCLRRTAEGTLKLAGPYQPSGAPQQQPQAPQQQQQTQAPAAPADQQAPAEQATQETPAEQLSNPLADPKVAAVLDDLADRVGDSTTANLVNELADLKEPSASTLAQIASRLGTDPDQARHMVDTVRRTYEASARHAIAETVGNDLVDAVLEHAQQTGTLSDAISKIAAGSTEGFSKLAQSYVASLDATNPSFILGAELPAGVTVRRTDSGAIVVSTPDSGGEVSWPVAVKLGLIRVGR